MTHTFTSRKRIRKSFGRHNIVSEMPNLIEIQKKSYDLFLQTETDPMQRDDRGLQAVFKSVFPIEDNSGQATLEFVKYEFDTPKYDVDECIQRDLTFSAPVRVTMRLIVWDVDEDTGTRDIKGIKEQDVYVGDLPLMTVNGTFVVNGTERVIVSQMHRSPGVFFDHDKGKSHSSGKFLFSARIIPYRGSWLDFEFDAKDLLYFRIDRRRKQYISSLLRALGMETREILDTFYSTSTIKKVAKGWSRDFNPDHIIPGAQQFDLTDAKTGKVIVEAGDKLTPRKAKKLAEEGLKTVLIGTEALTSTYVADDVVDSSTGEVIIEAASVLTEESIEALDTAGVKSLTIVDFPADSSPYLLTSLAADKNINREESLIDIYKVMRPGEPPTVDAAENIFNSLFFDAERYDLSNVGRMKMNKRLKVDTDESVHTLNKEDIIQIVRTLVDLKDGKGSIDDIDHLGNRRVRSVGELMENQFRIGLLRMERGILERMSSVEIDTVMPHDFVNAKPLAAVVKEFFGSSQLSQFMDQTNPLSEVTHKRRLSALGPGGLTRERAGFEVRDVHATHYGRICPIETPEGPNIGLINSLATFAQVNKYGFIETPFRKVKGGVVSDDVEYISAIEEKDCIIAQFDAERDDASKFTDDLLNCRHNGEWEMTAPADVTHADVSPRQLVSVAAALIPFLENDDANRALMGSNMMRQAVPLLRQAAPIVGTGMEEHVARDSGASITATHDGVVDSVDATRIVVKRVEGKENKVVGVDVYNLRKFQRSNQNTCMNQSPIVRVGNKVGAGDIIADGPSTDLGELALGYNVVAAFMPWNGYNYEDSILISERIVRDDIFTSIHIDQFETMARDTKLGPEEITCDIPNVGEENLRQLDETGIVHIGAEVNAGDILVGKVTPKSESPMTPEEKLLRAIFGEKAADVRDSSLRMKPGVGGRVVEVRIFSRRGIEKDERAMQIEREEIQLLTKDRNDEYKILSGHIFDDLKDVITSNEASKDAEGIKKGTQIAASDIASIPNAHLWNIGLKDDKAMDAIEDLRARHDKIVADLDARLQNKISKVQDGDDLPSGVLKMVKVFVAVKRKLQPGDKMAGRHGNKGVISRILPVSDMPYLEDGREVDIVLNPLGVPSRMNVGQILETHLGWASKEIGLQIADTLNSVNHGGSTLENLRENIKDAYASKVDQDEVQGMNEVDLRDLATNLSSGVPVATPVFDGAQESDITETLIKAGFDTSGQVQLYDGRTGEPFDRKTTVGVIYMLKLHHLVDDKIHARSIGPYSLVTQQPLGGKSHFGGQRFGEMECWALQAYGAAYTLQELLTVKSDDVLGRTKVYESIIKGDHTFDSGIPESFNVMVKELRSLCLNVELRQHAEKD
jgi:DNA-directed RNA polymerase subunit beta